MKFADRLKKLGACSPAVDWVGDRDAETAWAECERGDWMLWLAALTASRKRVVLAACECARLSLGCVPKDERRPLAAIEAAEAWARGEAGVSLDDVRRAAYAAYAAAYAAYAYATADAAYAAYATTRAADAACADAAAAAAATAAEATADAADAAKRANVLAKCADIVRRHFPACPLAEGGGE